MKQVIKAIVTLKPKSKSYHYNNESTVTRIEVELTKEY